MVNTSILALRCRAVQPLRVGEVPSIRSTRTSRGQRFAPARGPPVNWYVRAMGHLRLFLAVLLCVPGLGAAAFERKTIDCTPMSAEQLRVTQPEKLYKRKDAMRLESLSY